MLNHHDFLRRLARLVHWRSWHGRVIVWTAAAVAAMSVVLFAQAVDYAIDGFRLLRDAGAWLPFVAMPLGGVTIVWLTRRYFQGTEGSGIPQVIAALREVEGSPVVTRLVSLRIAIGKILLATAGLACGFSTGREGPSVQVAASIMQMFRNRLPARFPIHTHHLIVAGGSVGLAAAFNTPLAGIVFAIEELGRKFEERTNGVLLTAVILAGVISIAFQGNYTYFGHLVITDIGRHLLLPIVAVSVAGGVGGGLFSRSLLWSARRNGLLDAWRKQHPRNPYVLAAVCGLLVAGLGLLSAGDVNGSGYLVTRAALDGEHPLTLAFAAEKYAATLLSYFSGIPGGIFAPSLSIGAGIGQGLSGLLPSDVDTVAWMALGMTAFLAAVTQAPITAFVIVMEMIDGHTMVISLMATAFLSSLIARFFSHPLYQTLSHRVARTARAGLQLQSPAQAVSP
ncbi:MAG TPA: chloride channel protein [Candidatus Acidoferrum sp.]|nr:chloride channel protein [Candidatus Acidoferrum sp.]